MDGAEFNCRAPVVALGMSEFGTTKALLRERGWLHPRGVRPKRGPTPGVRRPRLHLLDHHKAPPSVQTARSTALLAASSVRHAPGAEAVGVRGLAAMEAQHD